MTRGDMLECLYFIQQVKVEDANSFHREDYYLAQIAQIVYQYILIRCNQSPTRVSLKDFLIEFEEQKEKEELVETDEEKKKRISDEHRTAIFAALGLNAEGKQVMKITEDGKMEKLVDVNPN